MAINYSYHVNRLVTDDSSDSPDGAVKEIYGYLYGIDENGKNTTELFHISIPFTQVVYKDEEQTFTDLNGDTYTEVVPVRHEEYIKWNDNFIPFENLDQTTVNAWIESLLSDEEKSGLKLRLSEKIQRSYNTSADSFTASRPSVPWSIESTPIE